MDAGSDAWLNLLGFIRVAFADVPRDFSFFESRRRVRRIQPPSLPRQRVSVSKQPGILAPFEPTQVGFAAVAAISIAQITPCIARRREWH